MKLTLGAFIASLRKEKGLTQREFAEMLSVSDKTVSHWECDKTSPDISLIIIIADIFGITADELLRCERKEEKKEELPKEEIEKTVTDYTLDIAFNKFRTKNFISAALTVISLFCGFIVSYFKTVYAGYIVFLALTVVPLLLTAVFRGGFSSCLVSADRDISVAYGKKANRITLFNLYFTFICFIIYSSRVILIQAAEFVLVFLLVIAAAGIIFLCEAVLRKRNLLFRSKKSLQIKKKALLKVMCTFLCVILLYGGYISHISINKETIMHKKAEYTLYTTEEFVSLMETDKPLPEEVYKDSHFNSSDKGTEYTFYPDFDYDDTVIEVIGEDNGISFIYNNLEIADYSHGPEGYKVYTHAQLLQAEKEADEEISRRVTAHFIYYPSAVIFCIGLYFILKKVSLKKKECFIIKDF